VLPLSGPVEGTICIKRKSSKVERRYRYDSSLVNGDSTWSIAFGCDLASGAFGDAKQERLPDPAVPFCR